MSPIKNFLDFWHQFPIDYWWRRKYNIPFGSKLHREMNFIDMVIEYEESLLFNKIMNDKDEELFDQEEGVNNAEPLTKEQINEDFEGLNLSEFDNL